MYDLFLINGLCPDFAANQMVKKNVGIKDGKIAYMGDEVLEAAQTVDCEGKVVSPGFVDLHMHEEILKIENYKYVIANMMLEQGVTTAVGGNCGNLRQPVAEFAKFVESEGGSPVNYILMAGYNTCREKAWAAINGYIDVDLCIPSLVYLCSRRYRGISSWYHFVVWHLRSYIHLGNYLWCSL